jgi:hypothetical protein
VESQQKFINGNNDVDYPYRLKSKKSKRSVSKTLKTSYGAKKLKTCLRLETYGSPSIAYSIKTSQIMLS